MASSLGWVGFHALLFKGVYVIQSSARNKVRVVCQTYQVHRAHSSFSSFISTVVHQNITIHTGSQAYATIFCSFLVWFCLLFFGPDSALLLFCFQGKTSLVHALVYGKDGNVAADQRTVGLDYYSWKPRPLTDELEILLVDCAGQRNYLLTHQFFLTEGELIFVKFPCHRVSFLYSVVCIWFLAIVYLVVFFRLIFFM